MPSRNDIDMLRSAERLLRLRLPEIVTSGVNLTAESVRALLDQCVSATKHLLALALHVSSTGQQGVEQIYEHLMVSI